MNELEAFFLSNEGPLIDKWQHYFEIYDRYFSKYRGKEVTLIEFGVFHGGSLQMWKEYFGPDARIIGVDINPACKALEEDNIEIIIGDQEDAKFLQSLVEMVPHFDILIDDGGHNMNQQITTFEELYYCIADDGVYVCEDLHTSYWEGFDGGYGNSDTFVEFSKKLIDHLNAWHSHQPDQFFVTEFTETTYSMHYYDSILVVEKRPIKSPQNVRSGRPTVSQQYWLERKSK